MFEEVERGSLLVEVFWGGEEGGEGVETGEEGRTVWGEERLMRRRDVVSWSMSMWPGEWGGNETSGGNAESCSVEKYGIKCLRKAIVLFRVAFLKFIIIYVYLFHTHVNGDQLVVIFSRTTSSAFDQVARPKLLLMHKCTHWKPLLRPLSKACALDSAPHLLNPPILNASIRRTNKKPIACCVASISTFTKTSPKPPFPSYTTMRRTHSPPGLLHIYPKNTTSTVMLVSAH